MTQHGTLQIVVCLSFSGNFTPRSPPTVATWRTMHGLSANGRKPSRALRQRQFVIQTLSGEFMAGSLSSGSHPGVQNRDVFG